jgi:DNA topoisomerase-1
VTTLHKRHACVRGDRVTFRFRAKHRALVRTSIVDPELADAVRELLSYPGGSRLFRFERNGGSALLTGSLLNAYVDEHLGAGFTTKDFRTWGGTLTAAIALAEHEPSTSEAEERRVLSAVMQQVGEELGNTAAVARESYVSPRSWSSGGRGRRSGPRSGVHGRRSSWLARAASCPKALLKLLRDSQRTRARAA